jgi:hypothetical protein
MKTKFNTTLIMSSEGFQEILVTVHDNEEPAALRIKQGADEVVFHLSDGMSFVASVADMVERHRKV